jgi:nitrous oxidase accessory protein NosD
VACASRNWSQLLDRSRSSLEAAAVWKRAWLMAPRGKLTLTAAIRSTRPGDRLRIAPGVHSAALNLPHTLEVVCEPGAVLTGPITISSGGAATAAAAASGVLRGLRIEHFYETAITVLSGRWLLQECVVTSSRGTSRACVGMVLRGASVIELDGCSISDCSSAVLLSSASAQLHARSTAFSNTRSAVESLRGGHIDVQRCSFTVLTTHDVGMRIAADTAGTVADNSVSGDGTLWGRLAPPPSVSVGEVGQQAGD